jgi:hypothetical protein
MKRGLTPISSGNGKLRIGDIPRQLISKLLAHESLKPAFQKTAKNVGFSEFAALSADADEIESEAPSAEPGLGDSIPTAAIRTKPAEAPCFRKACQSI